MGTRIRYLLSLPTLLCSCASVLTSGLLGTLTHRLLGSPCLTETPMVTPVLVCLGATASSNKNKPTSSLATLTGAWSASPSGLQWIYLHLESTCEFVPQNMGIYTTCLSLIHLFGSLSYFRPGTRLKSGTRGCLKKPPRRASQSRSQLS